MTTPARFVVRSSPEVLVPIDSKSKPAPLIDPPDLSEEDLRALALSTLMEYPELGDPEKAPGARVIDRLLAEECEAEPHSALIATLTRMRDPPFACRLAHVGDGNDAIALAFRHAHSVFVYTFQALLEQENPGWEADEAKPPEGSREKPIEDLQEGEILAFAAFEAARGALDALWDVVIHRKRGPR